MFFTERRGEKLYAQEILAQENENKITIHKMCIHKKYEKYYVCVRALIYA